jgi:hypothetical protein
MEFHFVDGGPLKLLRGDFRAVGDKSDCSCLEVPGIPLWLGFNERLQEWVEPKRRESLKWKETEMRGRPKMGSAPYAISLK